MDLSFVSNWQSDPIRNWVDGHPEVPAVIGFAYVLLVFLGPRYMRNRPAFNLKKYNIVWNLLLTIFSIVGAWHTVPSMLALIKPGGVLPKQMVNLDYVARERQEGGISKPALSLMSGEGDAITVRSGFYTSACFWNPAVFFDGTVGFWLAAFIFSKTPEMLDTAFLVFQKKPIIFLHWYHHLTVMMYCWDAYRQRTSSGLWFATMNYCVHSMMYFYYFICASGQRKLVRPYAPLITFLQIAQMVVGTVVTAYSLGNKLFTETGCDCEYSNLIGGIIMYGSYFVLFVKLFTDNYINKGAGKNPAPRPNGGKKTK